MCIQFKMNVCVSAFMWIFISPFAGQNQTFSIELTCTFENSIWMCMCHCFVCIGPTSKSIWTGIIMCLLFAKMQIHFVYLQKEKFITHITSSAYYFLIVNRSARTQYHRGKRNRIKFWDYIDRLSKNAFKERTHRKHSYLH